MSVPVVFIHTGSCPYLYHTIHQLRQADPGVQIYLIGTKETRIYSPFVTHIAIEHYWEEAKTAGDMYVHFSTNSIEFERICIQRWFVLKAFMEDKRIDRCFHLDSDVLVYTPVEQLASRYAQAGMTICGISGHSNFVQLPVLQAFCRYILQSYSGDEAIQYWSSWYTDFMKTHPAGGVSDMTLLTHFLEKYPDISVNVWSPDLPETFDASMEVGADYFIMEDGVKKIVFLKDKPYGIHRVSQQPVRFHTLHFQGGQHKKRMGRYVRQKTLSYHVRVVYFRMYTLLQKVMRRLGKV